MAHRGPQWAAWADALPATVRLLAERWCLRPDGQPGHGHCSLVLPVRTAAGTAAVLKVGFLDELEGLAGRRARLHLPTLRQQAPYVLIWLLLLIAVLGGFLGLLITMVKFWLIGRGWKNLGGMHCAKCKYVLEWLRPDADGFIRCPECGEAAFNTRSTAS
jgi:hypothetical protein